MNKGNPKKFVSLVGERDPYTTEFWASLSCPPTYGWNIVSLDEYITRFCRRPFLRSVFSPVSPIWLPPSYNKDSFVMSFDLLYVNKWQHIVCFCNINKFELRNGVQVLQITLKDNRNLVSGIIKLQRYISLVMARAYVDIYRRTNFDIDEIVFPSYAILEHKKILSTNTENDSLFVEFDAPHNLVIGKKTRIHIEPRFTFVRHNVSKDKKCMPLTCYVSYRVVAACAPDKTPVYFGNYVSWPE